MPSFYELIDLYSSLSMYTVTIYSMMMAIAAMYMVAVYNVGSKLTTVQMGLLNAVYIYVYGWMSLGYVLNRLAGNRYVYEAVAVAERGGLELTNLLPQEAWDVVDPNIAAYNTVGMMAVPFVLTLAFGWSIRHGHRRIAAPHIHSDNSEEEEQ